MSQISSLVLLMMMAIMLVMMLMIITMVMLIVIMIVIMNIEYSSLNTMQIKISFAAACDFNQLIHDTRSMFSALAPPRPTDFDPFPAPPRTVPYCVF